jgi:hypothetical protein
MALTPEGTPYVESTDLVANYPAASLSLANRVDLVGVLPFADSAARSAAITSPTDGQFTYLQDTNSTEFYNGSAFQAIGGFTLITSQVITAVTSVTVNNCFSATYTNYEIIFSVTTGASGSSSFRLRASGTDASGANYNQQRTTFGGTSTSPIRDANASQWFGQGLVATLNYFSMKVFRPFAAATTAMHTYSGRGTDTNIDTDIFTGGHTLATSYDGFTLAFGSTSTGTLRVYGYQD